METSGAEEVQNSSNVAGKPFKKEKIPPEDYKAEEKACDVLTSIIQILFRVLYTNKYSTSKKQSSAVCQRWSHFVLDWLSNVGPTVKPRRHFPTSAVTIRTTKSIVVL